MAQGRRRRYCLAMLLAACLGAQAVAEPPGEPAMSPVEPAVPQSLLLAFLADKSTFTLIDARSPEEFAASHIDGAINIPHDQVDRFAARLPAVPEATVVVYCRTGRRAGELQAALAERGYTDVRVLQSAQIFSSGDLMTFNCATPASKSPTGTESAAVDAREEERER